MYLLRETEKRGKRDGKFLTDSESKFLSTSKQYLIVTAMVSLHSNVH
jgi:hypothetical protein